MPDSSILNIGDLSKPATALIERVSDAIGGVFRPFQIKRMAHAEAEADRIRAVAGVEISEIQARGIARFFAQEGRKQQNIESITREAAQALPPDARPQDLQEDWLMFFLDRASHVSDVNMQALWARILASESIGSRSFSRRTLEAVNLLDKEDAHTFSKLCRFRCESLRMYPVVLDHRADVYKEQGIRFVDLQHLADIGLISLGPGTGFQEDGIGRQRIVAYFDRRFELTFPGEADNILDVGCALFTRVGLELAPISGAKPLAEFAMYLFDRWNQMGITVREMTREDTESADARAFR